MVMYMYALGSPFEDTMNHYMTTGIPISPFDPMFVKNLGIVGNETTEVLNISVA